MTARTTSPAQLCVHNLDAILAVAALPVFIATGLPLEGWFWAIVLWAVNRYAQATVERRAVRMGPLRGVGTLGASMLLRPWIGMLARLMMAGLGRSALEPSSASRCVSSTVRCWAR